MKKLKNLCAIVGVAAMFSSGAALATEINVPKYDLNNPSRTIEVYSEITLMGPQRVEKEAVTEGKKYNKEVYKLFDRNKDGTIDLLRLEVYQSEVKVKDIEGYLEAMEQQYGAELMKQFYGEDYKNVVSNMVLQEKAEQVFLAVDDEFNGGYDGYIERILMDVQNEKGEPFADGIFDEEKPAAPRITDYIPSD